MFAQKVCLGAMFLDACKRQYSPDVWYLAMSLTGLYLPAVLLDADTQGSNTVLPQQSELHVQVMCCVAELTLLLDGPLSR